jgi:hypothetical protein
MRALYRINTPLQEDFMTGEKALQMRKRKPEAKSGLVVATRSNFIADAKCSTTSACRRRSTWAGYLA